MILERSVGGGEVGLEDEVVVKEISELGVVAWWWLSRRQSDSGMVLVNCSRVYDGFCPKQNR